MMKRIVIAMLLMLIVFSGFAQDNHPVSWKIASEKTGRSTYKIRLQAVIKAPYHIYPQQTFDAGLGMPTEILFEEDDNVELVGKIEERGVEHASGESVAYYAKEVTFTQELKLRSAQKTTLRLTIKYMACTNEMCLPPSSKKFTLVLNDQDKGAGIPKNEKPVVVSKKPRASFTYEDFSMPDADGEIVSSRVPVE